MGARRRISSAVRRCVSGSLSVITSLIVPRRGQTCPLNRGNIVPIGASPDGSFRYWHETLRAVCCVEENARNRELKRHAPFAGTAIQSLRCTAHGQGTIADTVAGRCDRYRRATRHYCLVDAGANAECHLVRHAAPATCRPVTGYQGPPALPFSTMLSGHSCVSGNQPDASSSGWSRRQLPPLQGRYTK